MTVISDNAAVVYPDSDGKPMADNTLQFEWIATLKGGFDALYANRDDVFVAGDLLWYPVEGRPDVRVAPDVLLAFGRPKGYRGSYKQWEEDGIAPQVVFEVLSPNNTAGEMAGKAMFYDRCGVEEYYVIDPYRGELSVAMRSAQTGRLEPMPFARTWASPRTAVRFEQAEDGLTVFRPDGEPFKPFAEISRERDAERARADRLAARLRELGLDPDAL